MTTQRNLIWTDLDGDRCSLIAHESRQGAELAIAIVQIVDGETGRDMEVYVAEEDAERMIAWLTRRLADAA